MRAADPEISSKMSASPLERITPALGALTRQDAALPRGDTLAGALTLRPQLAVLTAFWIYVALSNVLYANSMQASFSNMKMERVFAPWVASITSFLVTYGFGLALVMGFAFYQRLRDSQLRSAALERALTRAHLAALRMQLSPHTLFNLLHTIRGQIAWDPPAAQAMVVQLGDLLRRLLNAGEREFSRLSDELQFVTLYLELQQRRFADRLTIEVPAREAHARAWVPSLILQPLVKNAVVHGLAGHEGAVTIRVEARVESEELTLRVLNTVAPGKLGGHSGIGLANVRERLTVQFGERAGFDAGPGADGLWVAQIRMPLLRDGPEGMARPEGGAAA